MANWQSSLISKTKKTQEKTKEPQIKQNKNKEGRWETNVTQRLTLIGCCVDPSPVAQLSPLCPFRIRIIGTRSRHTGISHGQSLVIRRANCLSFANQAGRGGGTRAHAHPHEFFARDVAAQRTGTVLSGGRAHPPAERCAAARIRTEKNDHPLSNYYRALPPD